MVIELLSAFGVAPVEAATDVIAHFEGVVKGELDLRLEASSASEFAANTVNDAGFRLPEVKWGFSNRRVMTMGWAEGIPLGDNAALQAAGHDLRALGERVLQLFLSHALRDGFFHADMHQGNLKVAANGDIIAYDFGIMGYISMNTPAGFMPRSCSGLSNGITSGWPRCISRPDTCRQIGMLTSLPAPCGPWGSRFSARKRASCRWAGC